MQAACKVIDRQRIKTAIPKFAEQFIRDIWILQPKLAAPRSKQIEQLVEHPRFRAGFDFLLLREQCGDAEHPLSESTNGMGDWWQTYQTLSEKQKQQAIHDFDENVRRGAHKRGRGRNRQKEQMTDNNVPVNQTENNAQANKNDAQINNSGSNKSMTVNDSSNIPSRRRRAVSKQTAPDTAAVGQSSSRAKTQRSQTQNAQQVKQDSNELAQLQQLSLASNAPKANQRNSPKAAPLFVIEHENVVPPLQKQLSEDQAKPSKVVETVQSEKSKAPANKVSAKQKASTQRDKTDANVDTSNKDQQARTNSTKAKQSFSAKANATRTVATIARSPELMSSNNEPIPYKRRRRQLHSEPQVTADVNAKASTSKQSKNPAAATKANSTPDPSNLDTNGQSKSVKKVTSRRSAKTTEETKADKTDKVAENKNLRLKTPS